MTKDEVNAAMKAAADGPLKGIIEYATDPLVSSDIIGNPHSCIFMADWTQRHRQGNLVKTIAWYDNEWGYSCRTAELIALLGRKLGLTATDRDWRMPDPRSGRGVSGIAELLPSTSEDHAVAQADDPRPGPERAGRCWSGSTSTSP